MSTDVQVIFFDLGDTLVYIKKEVREKICNLIQITTGGDIDSDIYMTAYTTEWKNRTKPYDNALIKEITTKEAERRYWENFLEALLFSLGVSSPPKMLLSWITEIYMDPKSYACFDDVKPILDELNHFGYRLGLISNAFPSASEMMKEVGLIQYFAWLFFSFELSYVKPEPEIYKFALEATGVKSINAMFIDDRLEFVKGARNEGMRAVLIERFTANKLTNSTGSLVERISGLKDLRSILKNDFSNPRSKSAG